MKEKIKSIRELVSNGNTKKALQNLKVLMDGNLQIQDDITVLLSRQSNHEKKVLRGGLSNEEVNIEQNGINHAVIELIKNIEIENGIQDEKAKSSATNFINELRRSREFTFLLVGTTGVGKSSTINNLMGTKIAEVGDFVPTTKSVKYYRVPIEEINFCVVDTPGLCDDVPEKGNDDKYIKEITEKVKLIDTLLYVTRLDDKRVRNDERQGIKLITTAFSENIWKNSIIVFTFSNNISFQKFNEALNVRTMLIRQAIEDSGASREIVNRIPSVAVDNESELNPDGKYWLGELYTQVAERVSHEGFAQFIISTIKRVEVIDNSIKNTQQVANSVEPHTQISPYIDFRPTIRVTKDREKASASKDRKEQEKSPTIKVTREQEKKIVEVAKEKGFFQKAEEFVEKKIIEPIKKGLNKIGKWLFG